MPLYPARALERAMKIKEVITRAMSGQINWLQAAEIIGITDRSMRRDSHGEAIHESVPGAWGERLL